MTKIRARNCTHCGDALKPRQGENPAKFAKRRFCSQDCNRAWRKKQVQLCKSDDCSDVAVAFGLCKYGYRLMRQGKYVGSCARTHATWMLPEDGIIDEIAVEIAVQGIRPVRLTCREAALVAARMSAAGYGTAVIAAHIGCETAFVRRVVSAGTAVAA